MKGTGWLIDHIPLVRFMKFQVALWDPYHADHSYTTACPIFAGVHCTGLLQYVIHAHGFLLTRGALL